MKISEDLDDAIQGVEKANASGDEIRPDYYEPNDAYEPWKVIDAWGLDFYIGTALKHLQRQAKLAKPGSERVEELRKALTYVKAALERAILAEPTGVASLDDSGRFPVEQIQMEPNS